YIYFKNYPSFSMFNLKEGFYEIEVTNGWCSKTFNVELKADILCDWYIPNVINPLSDSNNKFIFFTKGISEYKLSIYDRWGNLIHQNIYQSNLDGWNGYSQDMVVQPGVYAYVIQCLDKTF